jgi:hypothetical protein
MSFRLNGEKGLGTLELSHPREEWSLDGWLGELGQKNLLLFAASPAKPVELRELGDQKPNIFFSLFQQATTTKNQKINK